MADRFCTAPANGAGPSHSGDVLLVVSEGDGLPPEAVKRRPSAAITGEQHQDLAAQGIPRPRQQSEVTLVRSRYELDSERKLSGVMTGMPGGPLLSRADVIQQITTLMSSSHVREGTCRPVSLDHPAILNLLSFLTVTLHYM